MLHGGAAVGAGARSGELVTLDEQDRGAWDRALIAEGRDLLSERIEAVAAGGERPGRFQLQAAISAVHTGAPSARDTDWSAIVSLYDAPVRIDPSPVVRLNRAVAVAEVDGPAVGLAELDRLGATLDGYHAFHVARADLLRRLVRSGESQRHTTGPSSSPATLPSGPTSPGGATSSAPDGALAAVVRRQRRSRASR